MFVEFKNGKTTLANTITDICHLSKSQVKNKIKNRFMFGKKQRRANCIKSSLSITNLSPTVAIAGNLSILIRKKSEGHTIHYKASQCFCKKLENKDLSQTSSDVDLDFIKRKVRRETMRNSSRIKVLKIE